MSNIPDLMFERESLRAQVCKFKWLFLVMLLLLIIVVGRKSINFGHSDVIARIRVEGVLMDDVELSKKLKEIGEDSRIKAVILHVDSPGGDAYTGEELYVRLKNLAEKKPVVSVFGSVAASAGYLIALGTDHIIARNMTLTGSIGVLMQSFEMIEMAKKLGINFVMIKSSPFKAAPNPMEKMTPEVRLATMETIDDDYGVFLNYLMEGRKMSKTQALKVANGKVYSGIRAKELNLIDEIGGEEEAVLWLEQNKNISKKAHIIDIEWNEHEGALEEMANFFRNINQMIMQVFGKNGASMAKLG